MTTTINAHLYKFISEMTDAIFNEYAPRKVCDPQTFQEGLNKVNEGIKLCYESSIRFREDEEERRKQEKWREEIEGVVK